MIELVVMKTNDNLDMYISSSDHYYLYKDSVKSESFLLLSKGTLLNS